MILWRSNKLRGKLLWPSSSRSHLCDNSNVKLMHLKAASSASVPRDVHRWDGPLWLLFYWNFLSIDSQVAVEKVERLALK